jgi:hypothetical protein
MADARRIRLRGRGVMVAVMTGHRRFHLQRFADAA